MTIEKECKKLCAIALLVAVVVPAAVVSVQAVSTQFWTSATYEDFSRGNFTDISLGREGFLTLAPKLDEIFDTEQAMIWAVARDSRGNLYLGTGHSGKVFRLGPDLKGTLVFDAEEPDVFALAVDRDDRLYIGTSPDGKVYRLDTSGKAAEFFDPKTKYIWAMSFAPDGTLYVGTGDRGRIHRVRPDGAGEVFYETNQTHVMSLAMNAAGELLAGTEPNGLLYKISSAGKGFILYDATQGEVHRVLPVEDGSVYAALLGGGDQRQIRQPTPQPAPAPGAVTTAATITVRAAEDPLPMPGQPGGPEGQPGQPEQPAPQSSPGAAFATAVAARVPASAGRPQGGARSAIVRILPDSTVETLWTSQAENAFDLSPAADRLLFTTDEKGRIYQLVNGRDLALLAQTDQEQTTRLIPMNGFVLLTTANLGKVFRLGSEPAATGTYESDIRDAGNIAGWGQIRWRAELPPGTSLELYTRTGNSEKPDATWSEWSAAYTKADGQPITSPPARYAQWKAVFRSANNSSPVLQEVTLAYLPRNRAPEITEIRAAPRSERSGSTVAVAGSSGVSPGTTPARAFSGVASASRQNPPRGVDITWLASDPDQDELRYTLYFRGEGESEWKLLQEDLSQNYFQLNPDMLPDGKYQVKVVASDAGQNPAPTARVADRISAPFLVDNTAPVVEALPVERPRAAGSGGPTSATVRFRAADAASSLIRAEYAVDAEPLQPVLSDDGIVDSREESFTIHVVSGDGQEHLVTLRVYDSAGNVGIGKAILPGGGAPARR